MLDPEKFHGELQSSERITFFPTFWPWSRPCGVAATKALGQCSIEWFFEFSAIVGSAWGSRPEQRSRNGAAGAGAITVPHKSRNAPLKPLAGVEQIENQLGQLGCTKEQVKRHVNQVTISRMDAAKANSRPVADEG
jgi:hypothetical protein